MYRKPRFLEELHAIREEMSRDSDYDVDLFAEMVRSGRRPSYISTPDPALEPGDSMRSGEPPADESLEGSPADVRPNRIGGIPGVSSTSGPQF